MTVNVDYPSLLSGGQSRSVTRFSQNWTDIRDVEDIPQNRITRQNPHEGTGERHPPPLLLPLSSPRGITLWHCLYLLESQLEVGIPIIVHCQVSNAQSTMSTEFTVCAFQLWFQSKRVYNPTWSKKTKQKTNTVKAMSLSNVGFPKYWKAKGFQHRDPWTWFYSPNPQPTFMSSCSFLFLCFKKNKPMHLATLLSNKLMGKFSHVFDPLRPFPLVPLEEGSQEKPCSAWLHSSLKSIWLLMLD